MGERILPLARRRPRSHFDPGEPISKIDIRPMVFVVMLVVVILIIPMGQVRPHTLIIDIPRLEDYNDMKREAGFPADEPKNRLVVTADDRVLWNCKTVSERELRLLLEQSMSLSHEPLLIFEPQPQASYDRTAKTLALIKLSGATKFFFGGLERHREIRDDGGSKPLALFLGNTDAVPGSGSLC